MDRKPEEGGCGLVHFFSSLLQAQWLAVLWFFLLIFCTVAECGADATIFIYHRFDEDQYPTTNVPVESFREQMAYLRDNNYRVAPLKELIAALKNKEPIADKTVAALAAAIPSPIALSTIWAIIVCIQK